MTRISEAVECLESLGYTITAPGGERSARTTADALAEKPFGSLSREERLLFAIFNPERYWENRAAHYQERAAAAEAVITAVHDDMHLMQMTSDPNDSGAYVLGSTAEKAIFAAVHPEVTDPALTSPAVQS